MREMTGAVIQGSPETTTRNSARGSGARSSKGGRPEDFVAVAWRHACEGISEAKVGYRA